MTTEATGVSTSAADPAAPAVAATPAPAPVASSADSAPADRAPAALPLADESLAPTTENAAPVKWQETGDVGLDMALNYIGTRGFGQEHPAVQAAMQGDFSLLRASLAGLGDKAVGYEAYVALAERAYKDAVKSIQETEQKAISAVLEVVGSPEQWEAIHAWAKENADQDEKDELNEMLGGTPRQARAAAVYLRELYEKAHGTTVSPARAIKDAAGGGYSPAGGGPITDPKEYARAVSELHRKLGNRMEGSSEYAQLQQRRLMGRRIQR